MEKEKTIERRAAETILQEPKKIQIDGTEYSMQQPTLATLIMVSELIGDLPSLSSSKNLGEALVNAKYCGSLPRIAATLVLGALRIKEAHRIKIYDSTNFVFKRVWFAPWKKKRVVQVADVLEFDRLVTYFTDRVTIEWLAVFIMECIKDMQIADFFMLTTSLKGTNLLKRTREVEATQSGE